MDEYSLTLKYEKLIYKIARKFYNVELDDLYQNIMRDYDDRSTVPKEVIVEAFKKAYRRDEVWNLQAKLKR